MLDEISLFAFGTFAGRHADHALAPASLRAIRTDVGALDQSSMRDRDDHPFIRNQIFDRDFAFVRDDFREARIRVFVTNFFEFRFDDREHARFLCEDVEQVFDLLQNLIVLALDLVALHPGELVKTQLENRGDLRFTEKIAAVDQAGFAANQNAKAFDRRASEFIRHQLHLGFVAICRSANDADEIVEVREREQIALENFRSFLRLLQLIASAAQDYFAAMLDVALNHFLEIQDLWAAVIDCQHVRSKTALERSVLVKIIDDHLRDRVALEFDDHACVFIRLVANGGNVGENFLVHQLGDALDKHGAINV